MAATRNEKRDRQAPPNASSGESNRIHATNLVVDDAGPASTALALVGHPSVANWPATAVGNPLVAPESSVSAPVESETSSVRRRLTAHASFSNQPSLSEFEGSQAGIGDNMLVPAVDAPPPTRLALPPDAEGSMVAVDAAQREDNATPPHGDDEGEDAAAAAARGEACATLPDGRRMYTLPRSLSMSSASSSGDPLPCPPGLLDASLPASLVSTESERNREVSFEYPRDGPSRLPSPPDVFITLATAPIGPSSDAMWAQLGMDLMLVQSAEQDREREAQGLELSLLSSLSALRPPGAFGNGGTSAEHHRRGRWPRQSPASRGLSGSPASWVASGQSAVLYSPRGGAARAVSPSSAPPAPENDAFGDSSNDDLSGLVASGSTLSALAASPGDLDDG